MTETGTGPTRDDRPAEAGTRVRVLLLAATKVVHATLEHDVTAVAALGVHVDLACRFVPEAAVQSLPLHWHQVQPRVSGTPTRLRPRWWVNRWRSEVIRPMAPKTKPTMAFWLLASRDPWVMGRAADADVVIALDRYAVYTAWRIARRHRGADVVFGLAEGGRRVDRRTAARRPGPS